MSETLGTYSFMSDMLRKRGREPEALVDTMDVWEPKRFHAEEMERFLYLLQVDQTLTEDDEDEECAPSEELIEGVMRSLEEEIAVTCSTSNLFSDSGDNSAASDISRSCESQNLASDTDVHLSYLLEASDDDLGIPPSLVLDLKDEACVFTKGTSTVFWEKQDLQSLGENWIFEEDFDNKQQLALYEDAWDASELQDYMNRDFVSQGLLFDGELSTAWKLETASGL